MKNEMGFLVFKQSALNRGQQLPEFALALNSTNALHS
jgi:hypothetical protein